MAQAPDGAQRMTLRLQPEALGQVEIRIDTPSSGPVRVEISVERPETLALLQHDQLQLARALDQAGIPADGRSVTFHITPAAPPSGTGGGSGGGSLPSFAGDGTMGGNASGQGGNGGGTNGSTNGGTGSGMAGGSAGGASERDGGPAAPEPRWQSVGLDITA
jgi:hypothetical protein